MTSYKAYQDYREARVPTIVALPAHWSEKRLRFIANINPKKSKITLDASAQVSFVPMEAVGENGELDASAERTLSDVKDGYTYFANGDIVVAKITPCFENGKGAIASGLLNGVALGTTELHVVRPSSEIDARFLFYFCSSHLFRKIGESEMYGAGGQKRVPEDFLKNLWIGYPEMSEQIAISDFLDVQIGKIDKLVAEQSALLTLVEEQRQATIARRVTNGLNSDAPQKDSGLPWLGKIPAHWDVLEAKFALGLGTYGISESFQKHGEYGVLRMGDVGYGTISTDNLARMDTVAPDLVLRPGDLLFNRTNSYEQVAKIGLFEGTKNDQITFASYLVRFQASANPKYLTYLLNTPSFLEYVRSHAFRAIGQVNLNPTRYVQQKICLPPKEEQEAIVKCLDSELQRFNRMKSDIADVIKNLKEYRAALITQAVTGQIDVRKSGRDEVAA